jgi:dTDP-4-dehydrorhamnose 3,5-epimerase
MEFTETPLKDACTIELEPHFDKRGMFARAFCAREFRDHGLRADIMQCNISHNAKMGTLRGMHYQVNRFAETKIVRCIGGAIFDVIIDIRPDSPTYLQWFGVELSARNRVMLYVPEGFAHGYQTLTDDGEVFYMVTQFYAPECEGGIRWNDPFFGIEWPLSVTRISDKDASYPDWEIRE